MANNIDYTLLARGDFTYDGNENLLVRFIGHATEGNYYSIEILVLSRTQDGDLWSAVDGVNYVRMIKK